MTIIIAFAILTAVISILYAMYQWNRRREEIKRLTRDKKKEKKENNASVIFTVITTLLAAGLAIYSAVDQDVDSALEAKFKGSLSLSQHRLDSMTADLAVKSDSLKMNNDSLRLADLEIKNLQKFNLEKSERIISQQQKALAQSLKIIKIQKESVDQITGGTNKPIFYLAIRTDSTKDDDPKGKYFLKTVMRNEGRTNIHNVNVFYHDPFKRIELILKNHMDEMWDCIDFDGNETSVNNWGGIESPFITPDEKPHGDLVADEWLDVDAIFLPRKVRQITYDFKVVWSMGKYYVRITLQEIKNKICLKDYEFRDINGNIIEDVWKFFEYDPSKFTFLFGYLSCGEIQHNGRTYGVFWDKAEGQIILTNRRWPKAYNYSIFQPSSTFEAKQMASKILELLDEPFDMEHYWD